VPGRSPRACLCRYISIVDACRFVGYSVTCSIGWGLGYMNVSLGSLVLDGDTAPGLVLFLINVGSMVFAHMRIQPLVGSGRLLGGGCWVHCVGCIAWSALCGVHAPGCMPRDASRGLEGWGGVVVWWVASFYPRVLARVSTPVHACAGRHGLSPPPSPTAAWVLSPLHLGPLLPAPHRHHTGPVALCDTPSHSYSPLHPQTMPLKRPLALVPRVAQRPPL
jgi:hypothetical protein